MLQKQENKFIDKHYCFYNALKLKHEQAGVGLK